MFNFFTRSCPPISVIGGSRIPARRRHELCSNDLWSRCACVTISSSIQALKLTVAVQSKERPFCRKRFHDFNVFTDKNTAEKLLYMHRKPLYTRFD